MYISDFDKSRIETAADTRFADIVAHCGLTMRRAGSGLTGTCPFCGNDKKKFQINPTKKIWKCFSCDEGGVGAISFVMKKEAKTYPEALKLIADFAGIIIDTAPAPTKIINRRSRSTGAPACASHVSAPPASASPLSAPPASPPPPVTDPSPPSTPPSSGDGPGVRPLSFCSRMLAASGLTVDDITANVVNDANTTIARPTFISGTRDEYGRILEHQGDDVIIRYYDIHGHEATFRREKSAQDIPFQRIRWQYPELHLDKDGKPFKYFSPGGSGTHVYWPEKPRDMFRHKRPLQRLFIQEGEKKAEKATKHGLISAGISGIHCIARNKQLPHDLQLVIRDMQVREVIFMLDSDWDNLSSELSPDKDARQRPLTFYWAVRNYRDYFKALFNENINIEIYFGHVNTPTGDGLGDRLHEKGIDDLLAGSLAGREHELKDEIDRLVNTREPVGNFVTLHRISAMSDQALEKLWALDNVHTFAKRHREQLSAMPEFRFGRHRWRFNEAGEVESAQPIEPDEQYWEETPVQSRSGQVLRTDINFNYGRCFTFLQRRGFNRVTLANATIQLIRVQNGVLQTQDPWQVRDFVTDFTKAINRGDVLEMLYRGGPQYLGPEKLSNLDILIPEYERPMKAEQNLYFGQHCWTITAAGIASREIIHKERHIWTDHIIPFEASVIARPLIEFTRVTPEWLATQKPDVRARLAPYDGKLLYDVSPEGERCHFLQFLINASNFTWRTQSRIESMSADEIDAFHAEYYENADHLLAKLCAFGYMLHTYKDMTVTKAVVGVDGRQSEVGASNGRSGKSLLGMAVAQIRPQVYIPGKSKSLTDDTFLFHEVTEKTGNIFFDDVRVNFDFEALFPIITGSFTVNVKGGVGKEGRYTMPFNRSPKIYIATNHMINGEGSSFSDRMWTVAFSDFYNDYHKPIHDFGISFFSDDWPHEQWNLFYNLCALSIQLYLRHGVVESPNERIVMRRLRQGMGETFLLWAEEYYSNADNLNRQQPRADVTNHYLERNPEQRKFVTANQFKKKLKYFCEYKGYKLNPQLYDTVTGQPARFNRHGEPIIDDKKAGVEYFTIADANFANTILTDY